MRDSNGIKLQRLCGAGLVWIFAALMVVLASGAAVAATLTAALDREMVYEGETVEIAVTLQNAANAGEAPVPPEVEGLTFDRSRQSVERQQTYINGVYSSAVVYRYVVQAAGPGEYTIPGFTMDLDGTTVTTRPLRLRVLPGQNPAISQFAFLRLRTEKKQVYVGEALPVEIGVVYRPGGKYGEAPQLGQEGLTMGGMEQLPSRGERIRGVEYIVDTFRTYVIAARAGMLKLGPATVPFGLPVRSRLGLFSQEFRAVKLLSAVIDLEVLPLPEDGVPGGFTGAVGKYAMTVEASTNVVTAGDPILISIEISGEGPIQSLQLGGIADWEGFKTYAPETSVELKDKLGLQGSKRFTQVVIPESPEVKALPPIEFGYFDSGRGNYQSLRHEAIPITVRRGSVVAAYPSLPGTGAGNGQEQESREIVHIKSRLGSYGIVQGPLVMRPWFMGLQIAPLLALFGVTMWQWQRARVARDPRLRRRQQVERIVREGMKELPAAAARNDAEVFFATVFRMLQERLGEMMGMPAAAVDELVLDEFWEAKMGKDLSEEVRRLFHACGVARYAPGRLNAELHAFIPRVEAVLNLLRSVDPQ